MIPRFETYISSPPDAIEQRFVLVAYNEGRGKFKVRQNFQNEQAAPSYLVTSSPSKYSQAKEQLYSNLSMPLEQLFKEGALSISYVEGDALIEFPTEFSGKFDQQKLGQLAEMAVNGLASLCNDFAEPIYFENFTSEKSPKAMGALQLCLYVVLGISFIIVYYGSEVMPLDWVMMTIYCLGFIFIITLVFRSYSKALFETGKVFAICFIAASSVFLMLLIGVSSKYFAPYPLQKKEGIIEAVLQGAKYNVIRIRLASSPRASYLISRDYLKEPIERLPQAVRINIRPGFFGTSYVTDLEVIK